MPQTLRAEVIDGRVVIGLAVWVHGRNAIEMDLPLSSYVAN